MGVSLSRASVLQREIDDAQEGADAKDERDGLADVGDGVYGGDVVPVDGEFGCGDDCCGEEEFGDGVVDLEGLD